MTSDDYMHTATGIGMIGFIVMLATMIGDDRVLFLGQLRSDWPMPVSAGFGAFCSGLVTGGLFGRRGVAGGALAGFGAFLSTGLGSAIGGAVCFSLQGGMMESPVSGLILGPVFVAHALVQSTEVLMTWVGCFMALHLEVGRGRLHEAIPGNSGFP